MGFSEVSFTEMNMEWQGCVRRRLCFNKTLDARVLSNCCTFPLKGLTGVCLPEGKTEGTHLDKEKVLTNGLNMAAAQVYISIGYYFNQIYVGLVLETGRFPLGSSTRARREAHRLNQLT